jgi:hypothetical protein
VPKVASSSLISGDSQSTFRSDLQLTASGRIAVLERPLCLTVTRVLFVIRPVIIYLVT